ncbi:hypothetical protein H9P43_008583 [Blastocladiella emersonii ATCC 22665]|nr:hypothetical protein H9P43_008583 [Blastocladiella emersonii ATCC 22665]
MRTATFLVLLAALTVALLGLTAQVSAAPALARRDHPPTAAGSVSIQHHAGADDDHGTDAAVSIQHHAGGAEDGHGDAQAKQFGIQHHGGADDVHSETEVGIQNHGGAHPAGEAEVVEHGPNDGHTDHSH